MQIALKCTENLTFSINCLKCQACRKQINIKCPRLNTQGFLEYKRDIT